MKSNLISMVNKALAWLLILVATCIAWPAVAGVFSVTPIRIYMAVRDRAVAVTVTNEGDSEVVLQADIHTWEQDPDGSDKLTLTDDLILSPPILKLAPKARQVVRLARLAPPDPARQRTYRFVLREVPEATKQKRDVQISIALALSMPVFITPPGAGRDVTCGVARAEGKSLGLRCTNSGTAYAQIREIEILRDGRRLGKFEGGVYVLPGASKTIAVGTDATLAPGVVRAQVTFDDGKSQEFQFALP